ncbi:MAG: choice-of-anchor Q domain-containing protein [Rhodanobacteraceae bacterium]
MHTKDTWRGRAAAFAGAIGLASGVHAADGVVGPGNCDEAGFNTVLAAVDGSGGGTITFACGTATLTFTHFKEVASAVTIDGGGSITIDGGASSAFFQSFASASLTLKNLVLQHGTFAEAHPLENFGTLVLDHVRVLSSTSTDALLMNFGTVDVRSSTFAGNAVPAGQGGAIGNFGTQATVEASTFSGNSALQGGAIYSNATLAVVNSTFSANTGTGGGGAIYTVAGDANISFSTFAGNTAPFGAGVYNDGGGSGTMVVSSSLFAGNVDGNCDGVLSSGGYNLSDDTHCGSAFTGPGDENGVALALQPLGAYGGPTATQPPVAGDPAIDHVPAGSCPINVDQRGQPRPNGAACDTGAVEVGGETGGDLIFADGFDPT